MRKNKRIIYLVGAMSCYGYNGEYPKKWRKEVEEYFEKYSDSFVCISPTDYYEIGKDYHKSEREVMRFDLRKVRESDIVLVNLKDLDKSVGTSDEILYAFIRGIPVIGFTENESVENIHPWKIEQLDRIETGTNAMQKVMEYIKNYYYI